MWDIDFAQLVASLEVSPHSAQPMQREGSTLALIDTAAAAAPTSRPHQQMVVVDVIVYTHIHRLFDTYPFPFPFSSLPSQYTNDNDSTN